MPSVLTELKDHMKTVVLDATFKRVMPRYSYRLLQKEVAYLSYRKIGGGHTKDFLQAETYRGEFILANLELMEDYIPFLVKG